MRTETVTVNLADRSYPIIVGHGILDSLGERLAQRLPGRQAFVVTETNVGPLYADRVLQSLRQAGWKAQVHTAPAGEATKTLKHASLLWDELIRMDADRRVVVIALGGGVVGDLAGFAAATYARGVPFVQVPTTLLAMVDASVGGKVAVDHPRAKNMIGAFHQPSLVLCDLDALTSLPDRDLRSGMAEVVKHGVILDPDLFAQLEQQVAAANRREADILRLMVVRSCQIKGRVVEQDEHETTGLRAVLNYGHTFAHAFETAAGYEGLLHGEAVAIGMVCAADLARRLGRVDEAFCQRQQRLLEQLGLPTAIPRELGQHDLVATMRKDKKALAGTLRFILPKALGKVELVANVDPVLVTDVIRTHCLSR